MPILTARNFNSAKAVQETIADGGPGAFRQLWDLLRLGFGRPRFDIEEYYDYGLYRPEIRAQAKRTFLAKQDNRAFCSDLTGPAFDRYEPQFKDKLSFERRALAQGLPVATTVALFSMGPPEAGVPPLRTVDEIVTFLQTTKDLPLFGKPRHGSQSLGAVSIRSVSEDGTQAVLGNGKTVDVRALADDIARDWSDGYLFQRHLFNHVDLRPHFGQAMATARFVTLLGQTGPEMLYVLQRLPSPTAMHDCNSVNQRGHSGVNVQTGVIERIALYDRAGAKPQMHWNHPDGKPLVGMRLPFFDESCALCRRVHADYPGVALIGFDVAITDDGPVICELNSNPYLVSYQGTYYKGILSDEFLPRFATARRVVRENAGI